MDTRLGHAHQPLPARRLIRAQGRTVAWVAARLGLERAYLSMMLHGHRPMRRDVAERLALVLGVTVDDVLPPAPADADAVPV